MRTIRLLERGISGANKLDRFMSGAYHGKWYNSDNKGKNEFKGNHLKFFNSYDTGKNSTYGLQYNIWLECKGKKWSIARATSRLQKEKLDENGNYDFETCGYVMTTLENDLYEPFGYDSKATTMNQIADHITKSREVNQEVSTIDKNLYIIRYQLPEIFAPFSGIARLPLFGCPVKLKSGNTIIEKCLDELNEEYAHKHGEKCDLSNNIDVLGLVDKSLTDAGYK